MIVSKVTNGHRSKHIGGSKLDSLGSGDWLRKVPAVVVAV